MKRILLFAVLFPVFFVNARTVTTVPTFECISVYWSPDGGDYNKDVLVRYREVGSSTWKDGLNIKYNPLSAKIDPTNQKGGDYRGSIVNLTPDTEYEIELTLEGTNTTITYTEKTWSENFPIGKTIYPGKRSKMLTIYPSGSGTKNGYILYDGQGDTIDVNNIDDACIDLQASYIIIRNYVLTGGKKYGIFLKDDIHDVVIENCDISNWGEHGEGNATRYGVPQGAIQATRYGSYNACCDFKDLTRIIVQRNTIHDPRYGANSWAFSRDDNEGQYHPIGPQAVMFMNSKGNHVIRYNTVWSSDTAHYYNDILGYEGNQSERGFPGPDSDIYGNYLANCWDEPIEAEGGGQNVRVWGNYIEECYLPIAAASTRIGPLYVWRNVSGRTDTPEGSQYGDYQPFFKQEYWEGGFKYLFNNTILQPNDHGAGGIATKDGISGRLENFITRNNIIHVRSDGDQSILTGTPKGYCEFDYDLCSGSYPSGYEVHGIDGTPTYAGAGFDKTTMTGDFSLKAGTSGHDNGVVVNNFIEEFEGAAPDMGASEVGGAVLQYGVEAYKHSDVITVTTSAINGQVNPVDGSFAKGSKVQFTATPDKGYVFESWGGDLSAQTTNPVTVVADKDMNVSATFTALPTYNLTTVTVGKGRVSAASNGTYFQGDVVILRAFPNFLESFIRWEGDLSSTENPDTIVMDSTIEITAVFSGATAILENGSNNFGLQNYPNPFSNYTTIKYELDKSGVVTLSIFDLAGNKVVNLINGYQQQGIYKIKWNGKDHKGNSLPNGVYINELRVGDKTDVNELLINN